MERKKVVISLNDNLVTIEVNGKVIFAGKADLQFSLNQKVREPLRITKGKGKLMEALTESFIKGGINDMENRPIGRTTGNNKRISHL